MGLKSNLTAALLAFATLAATSQTGLALPTAPPAAIVSTEMVVPVHDGIYWRDRRPYYNGHRGYPTRRPGYRYHDGYWFPHAAFSFGIIIGPRTYQLTEAHYRWCERRYKTYRRWDNTFQPNYGPRKACVSPYLR